MRKILLILTAFSAMAIADFSRSAVGVVTDSVTGLQWQDDYGDNGGAVKSATWIDAIDYCEALTLGGYDDWRLPNIRELNSIVDLSRVGPAIDPVFQNTESVNYWSSTTYAGFKNSAWDVGFDYGYRNGDFKTYTHYVRCVRSGQ